MKYLSIIDPHTHLRGGEYETYHFLKQALRDAEKVGICAILEMPNPTPHLTSWKTIAPRIKECDKYRGNIFHGIHIGLTGNGKQVQKAIELAKSSQRRSETIWKKRVMSDKTFYVHSTGDMGIVNESTQKRNWKHSNHK